MENNSEGRSNEIAKLQKKLNKIKQKSNEVKFQQDTDGMDEGEDR